MGLWVPMTAMPQRTALSHAFGGLAAALVGVSEFLRHGEHLGTFKVTALGFEVLLGGITFTGSLVAFAKLQELVKGTPITYPGQNVGNFLLFGSAFVIFIALVLSRPHDPLLRDVRPRAPLRRAPRPADRGGGHARRDRAPELVRGPRVRGHGLRAREQRPHHRGHAGRRVGLHPLDPHVQGDEPLDHERPLRGVRERRAATVEAGEEGVMREVSLEDVATQLAYARKVVFVPGYGMATAQAQNAVRELATHLEGRGVEVKYGIHPVAGRMPGHMNVLLAEANVPYSQLYELEQINAEMPTTDVAVVIGANDVVNPEARDNPKSAIAGMPIIEVDRAKSVIVLKRGRGKGFSGLENPLFFKRVTGLLFGDAKSSLNRLSAAVQEL